MVCVGPQPHRGKKKSLPEVMSSSNDTNIDSSTLKRCLFCLIINYFLSCIVTECEAKPFRDGLNSLNTLDRKQ